MLTRSVLALGSLSVLACAVLAPRALRSASPALEPGPAPQASGDQGHGQGLNGCDIDLRADDTHHEEVQAFWKANNQHAVQYDLWDRNSDAMMIGDANGAPGVLVKAGGPNSVVFRYDEASKQVMLDLVNAAGDKYSFAPVEPDGRFDRLALPVDPTWTDVRHPTDPSLRCIRVSAENFGITYAFTLAQQ
jgi:hypothetical protein